MFSDLQGLHISEEEKRNVGEHVLFVCAFVYMMILILPLWVGDPRPRCMKPCRVMHTYTQTLPLQLLSDEKEQMLLNREDAKQSKLSVCS